MKADWIQTETTLSHVHFRTSRLWSVQQLCVQDEAASIMSQSLQFQKCVRVKRCSACCTDCSPLHSRLRKISSHWFLLVWPPVAPWETAASGPGTAQTVTAAHTRTKCQLYHCQLCWWIMVNLENAIYYLRPFLRRRSRTLWVITYQTGNSLIVNNPVLLLSQSLNIYERQKQSSEII